jgi:hypothetical protein
VKAKLAIFGAVVLVAVVGTIVYVLNVHKDQDKAAKAASVATRTDLSSLQKAPHIVFRSSALGAGFGRAAVVPLDDPDGARAFSDSTCDRVYSRTDGTVCLVANRGLATTYEMQVLNPQWTQLRDAPLPGLPSRARMSRDGSLLATTTFVFGDAYTNPGQFSTRTLISPVKGGDEADLEKFALLVDGKTVTSSDKNIWGVTFADDNTFYATAASGKKTWLVQGSLSGKTLTALREDVECPSLSPDGTKIAFKRHGDLPNGKWHLSVYDLTTKKETLLAESRSVDDQAEWLDNDRVLYGLPHDKGVGSDVWVARADGSGQPSVFIPDAESPSVVRSFV